MISFFKKHSFFCLLISVVSVFLGIKNISNYNFFYQIQYDSDSAIHYNQLLTIFDGYKTLDLIKMLTFNFNNGYIYFLIHGLFALPALILGDFNQVVLYTRGLTSLFALGSLVIIYFISKQYVSKRLSLMVSSLIVLQPMFFIASQRFRPDWALCFLLLLCLFYLNQDKQRFSKPFWISSAILGVAIATKTQGITFLPLLFFYCFSSNVIHVDLKSLKQNSMSFIKSIGITISVYIVLTPYVLHPVGFYGVVRRFTRELHFMSSNTFTNISKPLSERIEMINHYFVPTFIFLGIVILLLASLIYIGISRFQSIKDKSFLMAMSATLLINIIYLLCISKKLNANFLMPIFVVYPLILLIFIRKTPPINQFILTSVIFVISLAPITHQFNTLFFQKELSEQIANIKREEFIISTIKQLNKSEPIHILITPSISFNYRKIGLYYNHIHYVFLGLKPYHIDYNSHEKKWEKLRHIQEKLSLEKMKIKPFYEKDIVIVKGSAVSEMKSYSEYQLIGHDQGIYIYEKN